MLAYLNIESVADFIGIRTNTEEHAKAMGDIGKAVQEVLVTKGINTDFLLEDGSGKQQQALLPLAA